MATMRPQRVAIIGSSSGWVIGEKAVEGDRQDHAIAASDMPAIGTSSVQPGIVDQDLRHGGGEQRAASAPSGAGDVGQVAAAAPRPSRPDARCRPHESLRPPSMAAMGVDDHVQPGGGQAVADGGADRARAARHQRASSYAGAFRPIRDGRFGPPPPA